MLNKEILEEEIKDLEAAYANEKNKNGGHDGTVLALILKSKIEVLNDLMKRYFMSLIIETSEQILDFINAEVPFDELKKNEGIYETNLIKTTDSSNYSIGVSYEDNDDKEEVYIYNVFIDGEYINIGEVGDKEDRTPISVLDEIRDVLLKL